MMVGTPATNRLLSELDSRVPLELWRRFLEEVGSIDPPPSDPVALLDALDRIALGLGVAIGRGETGQELRFRQLVELVAWLYHELGQPQDSAYAVGRRAASAMDTVAAERTGK